MMRAAIDSVFCLANPKGTPPDSLRKPAAFAFLHAWRQAETAAASGPCKTYWPQERSEGAVGPIAHGKHVARFSPGRNPHSVPCPTVPFVQVRFPMFDTSQNARGESIDRTRLALLLGMLGSAHAGEIINAARAAERLRHDAGLTWHDILASDSGKELEVATAACRKLLDENDELRSQITHLRAIITDPDRLITMWSQRLNPWEQGFLASVRHRHRLSPKQRACLRRILAKLDVDQLEEADA
jgi:hypothetical protein